MNIPINYSTDIHPMVLLPSTASLNFTNSPSHPADLFTRPLTPTPTHHRFKALTTTTVTPTTVSTSSGASASVVSTSGASTTSNAPSDLVPAPLVPRRIILDSGASRSFTPFKSDFTSDLVLPLNKRPFGIPTSASGTLPALYLDPHTLITGESTGTDLSSPDYYEIASEFPTLCSRRHEIKFFGTALLIFIYSNSTSDLVNLFVEPDFHFEDWLHWIPVPRLTLRDSYFQVVPGTTLDYTQVFGLLHLIPIWFYLALLCFE